MILILIVGCNTQTNDLSSELSSSEIKEIFCPNYDGNEIGCLSHDECIWIIEESICNPIDAEEIDENGDFDMQFEMPDVPNTKSNQICHQLPLPSSTNPSERFYCFAVVNNDPSFCDNIDDEDSKNLCLAVSKQDSSFCRDSGDKKSCYNALAQISENIDFCGDITYSSHEKQQCYFNFVNALYWEDKSSQITTEDCEKVGMDHSDEDENTCLAYMYRDSSYCGNNVNCLTFFVQDMSFCDEHPELDSCIRDRAMTEKNLEICKTLPYDSKDDCIGDFASHIQQDTAICDLLENLPLKQMCYAEVAIHIS